MFYTDGQLDRADRFRKDDTKLKQLYQSDNAQLIPVWRGNMLVGNGPRLLTIPTQACPSSAKPNIFLGLLNDTPLFARSLTELEESNLTQWQSLANEANPDSQQGTQNAEFQNLREIGPALPTNDGALMAYARGITYWHDTSLFCSRCGHELHCINGGHIKCCSNDTCSYQSFPRTDPAVIMLVTKDATGDELAQCLLGRNAAWPKGVFSTLAGFVETGESLEQAVQREVFEESGIETNDVRYIASQPWPFPRSIMLGFEANAISTDINIDPIEIEDARWFTADELKTFGTWGDEQYEFQLPRTDSIARFLIDGWIKRHV